MKPLRYATLLALSYLLVASGYILVSGSVAAAVAKNVAELEYIEHMKGLVFVLVTGTLLFFASWLLFLKSARAEEARALERRTLTLMQNKAYAAELAAAVAHDFNNLLVVLHAGVDELALNDKDPPDSAILEEMRQALDSARDLTKRMAQAARGERSTFAVSSCLATFVEESMRLLRKLPRIRGREIKLESTSTASAILDPVSVEQILVNLLFNAADAAGDGGKILVEVNEDAQSVCLRVHDSGNGLTDAQLRNFLQPFTTTKESGLGLGLLSVRASVEGSQGTLTVLRSPLGGALFEVRWPRTN